MKRTPSDKTMTASGGPPCGQRGSALIVSLLILVVLTLIGVTAVSTSGLEERMAGNNRDRDMAFEAAEVGLRAGEAFVQGLASTAAFNNSNGLYANTAQPDISASSTVWSGSNSRVYSGTLSGIASAPRYIVQVLGSQGNNDVNMGGYGVSSGVGAITDFRITARGTGISDTSAVIVQSYYAMRVQ